MNLSKISSTIESLILFYFPSGCTIFDPTCGIADKQFQWIKQQRIDCEYKIIRADLKDTGDIRSSFTHIPLKDNAVQVVFLRGPVTLVDKMFLVQPKT